DETFAPTHPQRASPSASAHFPRSRGKAYNVAMTFPTAASTHDLERGTTLAPRFDANGLIAAVATHAETGEVLMLAWMNAQALRLTLDTGQAHYFSRSRGALWKKGET